MIDKLPAYSFRYDPHGRGFQIILLGRPGVIQWVKGRRAAERAVRSLNLAARQPWYQKES